MIKTILMIITIIAIVVIIAASILALKPIEQLLLSKLDEKNYERLKSVMKVAVEWAHQYLWGSTGEYKKAEVLKYVSKFCIDNGLDYTNDDLDKALEAAYLEVKRKDKTIQED